MPKIRLYVNQKLAQGKIVDLDADQSHYLRNVMRVCENDTIIAFNESEGECKSRVVNITKKQVSVEICEFIKNNILIEKPKIKLIFPLLKNVTPSFIVQKATELGVVDIFPVAFQHSVIKKSNTEKLRKVAIEAVEQSNRIAIPNIYDMQTFDKLLSTLEDLLKCSGKDQKVLFITALTKDELEFCEKKFNVKDYRIYKNKIRQHDENQYDEKYNKIFLLVGPEGGFHYNELQSLFNLRKMYEDVMHVYAINFGNAILRSETAIITSLGVLYYDLI